MTFQEAVKPLEAEYEKGKQLEYVQNPLAYALYNVWKTADKEGGQKK